MQIDQLEIKPDVQLFASSLEWRLHSPVDADDISPDLIADVVKKSLDTLLEQTFRKMVALDWSTAASHITGSGPVRELITSVAILR